MIAQHPSCVLLGNSETEVCDENKGSESSNTPNILISVPIVSVGASYSYHSNALGPSESVPNHSNSDITLVLLVGI